MGASPSSTSPATPHRCRRRTRLGTGDVARPRRGISAVPQLPHPARRGVLGQLRPICRPCMATAAARGPIRSRPAGPSPSTASCPAHTLCSRTSRPSRPPATPAISGPPRQLSGGVQQRDGRRRHDTRADRRRAWVQRRRLVAERRTGDKLWLCDLHVRKPSWQTDTGCSQQSSGKTVGRAYADISADADPATGLSFYDSNNGGWGVIGGTSLAAPLIAAYYAITGVDGTTPQWAYTSSSLLNDPTSGSSGSCAPAHPLHLHRRARPTTDRRASARSQARSRPELLGSAGRRSVPAIRPPTPRARVVAARRSREASIPTAPTRPGGSSTARHLLRTARLRPSISAPATRPSSVTGLPARVCPRPPRITTGSWPATASGRRTGYDYTFTTPQSSPNDPTASFTAPTATAPTTATTFDAGTSTDSGDAIADYTWDFGDGHTVDAGPSATTSHVYTALGTYNVTLIVTSSDGHSDSVTQQVTVDNPTASFTALAASRPR